MISLLSSVTTKFWVDTNPNSTDLTVNISALRKALGERPNEQRFIRTIPGRGYRFVAEVREATAPVEELIVHETKMRVVIEEEETGEPGKGETSRHGEGGTRKLSDAAIKSRFATRSVFVVIALFVVLLAGAGYWRKARINSQFSIPNPQPATSNPESSIRSLAVLPFKSLNPKSGEEYLGVGMADVMITRLSNLSQLAVRPTSSVLPFDGKDALQAGQALKVDSVLDGSIQQIDNRVRVTVRLLRVSDKQPLWAYQCDELCTDVFKLQDVVAANVTEALATKLTSEERQRMNRRYTEDPAAYQAYVRGRYHTLQYTPEGNQKAIEELNEALRLDPSYALAYAGLADAYTASSEWLLPPREAMAKARAAAEKALALDDTLAEAHAALGHVFVHQFNPAAEAQFQRAMELNPNSVAAMFFYSEYFYTRGETDKSLAGLRLDGLRSDPRFADLLRRAGPQP